MIVKDKLNMFVKSVHKRKCQRNILFYFILFGDKPAWLFPIVKP